jgi:signal transduction histidine kinase
MSDATIIFFLSLCIVLLICVILYQQFVFRTGIQAKLQKISGKLKEISDTDSDERIMVFTENKELMELAAQINRLLENHLKTKADYRRTEIASKKMLSNISHDIKTPMTVILGYLEIMRINGTGTDEMIKKTEQKAQNVMELINQFFTLAKLESGDMDIELSRINVCEVCRESILDFYEILTNNEFQVDIDMPENPIYVQGNTEALQRILFNLISNVIRYGADGKYLGLFLRTDEKTVYIDVTDKGKGIDKSFAESVFDRLFTMEDSRNRNIQGNGLGLTIAKNLALQLGGTIALDSTPYEKTTFTVKLKKISY